MNRILVVLFCAVSFTSAAQIQVQQSFSFQLGTNNTFADSGNFDAAGNLYLAGYAQEEGDQDTLYVTKLSPEGNPVWTWTKRAISNEWVGATALAINSSGMVFISCFSSTAWSTELISSCVRAFDPDGNLVRETNFTDRTIDSLKLDESENLVCAGHRWAINADGEKDIVETFIEKRSADLQELLWTFVWPRRERDISYAVALATRGNDFYVARIVAGRLLVTCLDTNGEVTREHRYAGPFLSSNPLGLMVDDNGTLFAAADGSSGSCVLVEFTDAGQQWATRLPRQVFDSGLIIGASGILFGGEPDLALIDRSGFARRLKLLPSSTNLTSGEVRDTAKRADGSIAFIMTLPASEDPNSDQWRVGVHLYQLTNTPPAPSLVNSVPGSKTVARSNTVTVTLQITNETSSRYQWFFERQAGPLEGQTNRALTVESVDFGTAGAYWVEITNAEGEFILPEVVIDLFEAPQPLNEAVLGETVTLSASGYLAPQQSAQWFRNGVALSSATNSTLTLSNISVSDAGTYTVSTREAFGDEFRAEARVQVCDQVRLEWQKSYPGLLFAGEALDAAGNLTILGTANVPPGEQLSHVISISSAGRVNNELVLQGTGQSVTAAASGEVFLNTGKLFSGAPYHTFVTHVFAAGLTDPLWRRTNAIPSYNAGSRNPMVYVDNALFVPSQGQLLSAAGETFFSILRITETNSTAVLGDGGYDYGASLYDLRAGGEHDVFALTRTDNTRVYTLTRLHSTGAIMWHRNLQTNGYVSALAIDSAGNAVVAGGDFGANPLWVCKISASNQALWSHTFIDPALFARAVAIDSSDSIVVAGDTATIKVDAAGRLLWCARTGGSSLALDASQNIYVAGGNATPQMISAISPAGTRLWQAAYGNSAVRTAPISLAGVTAAGEVYVASGSSISKYSAGPGTHAPGNAVLPGIIEVSAGTSATLGIEAPAADVQYQWFFNGVAIEGATNVTFTISNVMASIEGGYSLESRNSFGSTLSAEAWLATRVSLTRIPMLNGVAWRFPTDPRYSYQVTSSTNLRDWMVEQRYIQSSTAVVVVRSNLQSQEFLRVMKMR